jgi:hypothetical protein
MGARGAVLDPTDVQEGTPEVDLLPTKAYHLRSAQGMPKGEQDHESVAPAMPIPTRHLEQALDLVLGQVLAGAEASIRRAAPRQCRIAQSQAREPLMPQGLPR